MTKKKRSMLLAFKREQLDIIGIQESHIANEREANELRLKWKGEVHFSPSGQNRSKGVVTLFKQGLADENPKQLYASVTGTMVISSVKVQNELVYIINVYSPCDDKEKLAFLEELNIAINTHIDVKDDTNVICLGDFNIAVNSGDVVSGKMHSPNSRNALNNFVQSNNLHDSWRLVHPEENNFTWSRAYPPTAKRLDYIFTSESLASYISNSTIVSVALTDHRLVTTSFLLSSFTVGKGLFKMNVSVLSDLEYCRLINNEIINTMEEYRNVNPHLLWEMIKINVKELTQIYCKAKRKKLADRNELLRNQLQLLEDQLVKEPNKEEVMREIGTVKGELEVLEIAAARGAQIRARMEDIEDGEKCNSYFLSMEKHRANINTIKSLTGEDGRLITKEKEIVEEIGKRFEVRYNKVQKSREFISNAMRNFTRELNLPSLDEEERERIDAALSVEEISNSLKSMKHGSAPGGDGIPVEFYKVFWVHLKEPLMNCYKFSFEQSILPPSERIGVIALFHKGSELAADNLNNWRPISLTNVDYKILAKAMSIRINRVINKLIGMQQVGFMKGRNISLIHRQIDDLLNIQRRNNAAGILLAIDFRQAFDAISIECILNGLKIFGFGDTFIKWIRILNTERLACVKNGGYISDTFTMNNGVRQGCPISPQLFILAVELLAQKIIQDPRIRGLNPHRCEHPKKIEQYADDTTLYLKDTNDLKRALAHLREFSIFSGLYLNLDKSFALSTNGAPVDLGDIPIKFKTTVKILGVYFSHLFPAMYIKENYLERLEKVKRILGAWSKRKLTLIGKIHVIKTYGMSQFIFIMKSVGLSTKVLGDINYLFYSFLWKNKMDNKKPCEKIRRSVLCANYEWGGLRMIDMEQLQKSIMLEWAETLLSGENREWKNLALFFFRHIGGKTAFRCNSAVKEFQGFNTIDSLFWKEVYTTWLYFSNKKSSASEEASFLYLNDPIYNNKHVKFKGKVVFLPTCMAKGVITIGNMMTNDRLLTLREFINKYGAYPRNVLDFNVLRNSLNNVMHKVLLQEQLTLKTRDNVVGQIGRKYFYNCLISDLSLDSPLCVGLWQRKLGTTIGPKHWQLVHALKETRLRALSWKVMNNIYPTSISLCKMGLSDTENCKYCYTIDTLEHFFYFCSKVKPLWRAIKSDILRHFNINADINERVIILGPLGLTGIEMKQAEKLNQIIAVGKMVISKFKYGPQRNIMEIYETECTIRNLWS